MEKIGLKELDFEYGELVKLGNDLWADVADNKGCQIIEDNFKNQLAIYIGKKYIKRLEEIQHKIFIFNDFYWIVDNSFACIKDSERNLQKLT